jgi:hypothetical protein
MNQKPKLHRSRPNAMKGIDHRRMRRLPMRSISCKATQVMIKFVSATDSAVRVGLEKPMMENMVAEKYIREFWMVSPLAEVNAEGE